MSHTFRVPFLDIIRQPLPGESNYGFQHFCYDFTTPERVAPLVLSSPVWPAVWNIELHNESDSCRAQFFIRVESDPVVRWKVETTDYVVTNSVLEPPQGVSAFYSLPLAYTLFEPSP